MDNNGWGMYGPTPNYNQQYAIAPVNVNEMNGKIIRQTALCCTATFIAGVTLGVVITKNLHHDNNTSNLKIDSVI